MTKKQSPTSLSAIMERQIETLRLSGHERTAETYAVSLKCFVREMGDAEIADINSDLMLAFEAKLRQRNLKPNTTSFYLRVLKAAYNRAIGELGCPDARPFAKAFTGVAATEKRGLSDEAVNRILALDLASRPKLLYARDIFIFLLLTRGMSLIDAAFLRKSDLCDGVLTYRRRKTHQMMRIKWSAHMQRIVDAHSDPSSPYMLPLLRKGETNQRRRHLSCACLINRRLKTIARMANIPQRLTTYVSRHSWASIAKSLRIPLPVISECLGHESERTTRIYLTALDSSVLDKANEKVTSRLNLA